MRNITLTCDECGSIVAGNVLEKRRRVACPGVDCSETLHFEELSNEEQHHLVAHADKYQIE